MNEPPAFFKGNPEKQVKPGGGAQHGGAYKGRHLLSCQVLSAVLTKAAVGLMAATLPTFPEPPATTNFKRAERSPRLKAQR